MIPGEGLLDFLFLLLRSAKLYGANHPTLRKTAVSVAELLGTMTLPVSLQGVGGFIFQDGRLLPMTEERFANGQQFFESLDACGANEITIGQAEAGPLVQSLVDLMGAILARDLIEDRSFGTITARPIQGANLGEASEEVDAPVFAATQIALAVGDAEGLMGASEWNVQQALSIARRLETSWSRAQHIAFAVMERAPGEWSPARRVVAAGLGISALLDSMGVARGLRRAAVHVVTLTGCLGYREEGGLDLVEAAKRATELAGALPLRRGRLDPHIQRVLTLLYDLEHPRKERKLSLSNAVALAYGMEKNRISGELVLDSIDLMAHAAQQMGSEYDADWIRAYIDLRGELPAGASVKLGDGRRGVVLGPGANAGGYQLLVDGALLDVKQRPEWVR